MVVRPKAARATRKPITTKGKKPSQREKESKGIFFDGLEHGKSLSVLANFSKEPQWP